MNNETPPSARRRLCVNEIADLVRSYDGTLAIDIRMIEDAIGISAGCQQFSLDQCAEFIALRAGTHWTTSNDSMRYEFSKSFREAVQSDCLGEYEEQEEEMPLNAQLIAISKAGKAETAPWMPFRFVVDDTLWEVRNEKEWEAMVAEVEAKHGWRRSILLNHSLLDGAKPDGVFRFVLQMSHRQGMLRWFFTRHGMRTGE
jgi:hypothetical protein